MTEKNKPENQKTEITQEKKDSGSYGSGLVVVNTIILTLFAIITLVVANNNGFFDKYAKSEVEPKVMAQTHEQAEKVQDVEKVSELVTPHISEQAKVHILYGDETGGAHYHTVKTPCKSIFPKNWSPSKIIQVTEKIAANDNLEWKVRKNGNMSAQTMEDEILVRVIMDAKRQFVKTSYPLNAGRTPCPKDDMKTQPNIIKETRYFKVLDVVDTKSKKNYNH